MMDQWEILSRSQVHFITLYFGQLCCAIYQPRQAARICAEIPISWAKPAHFDFFAINCTVWSHKPCTGGDALMPSLISFLINRLYCTATQYVTNQSLNCMTYRPSFLVSLLFCLPRATTQFDHHHVCTTPVDVYHIMERHLIAFLPYCPFVLSLNSSRLMNSIQS
jgi:hypothetical protein